MGWFKTAVAESCGLFVDDGRYALFIVVWLALAWLVLPRLGLAGGWNAAILSVNLLLILLEGSLCGAHKRYDCSLRHEYDWEAPLPAGEGRL